jgi:UPF0755 protein
VGLRPIIDRLTEPDDYTGNGSGDVQVKIAPGSSGAVIGRVLAAADVVKTQKAFVDQVRSNSRAASIQPGTYKLRKQMSAASALTLLLDPASQLKLSVTIPEGKRVPETLDILSKQLGLARADFDAALKDPKSIGLTTPTNGPRPQDDVEGFLFPSTYDFEPDVTATDVLTRMVQQTDKVLDAEGVPANRRHDVITKAAIIQAEAASTRTCRRCPRCSTTGSTATSSCSSTRRQLRRQQVQRDDDAGRPRLEVAVQHLRLLRAAARADLLAGRRRDQGGPGAGGPGRGCSS